MARYWANATGNYGTAATWDLVRNTPTLHASTNVSVPVAGLLTATFTAPNTTSAVTGVSIYLTSKAASGSPTTITATLQEATVDTACTKTITLANVNTGWVKFKVPTPYVYTATTAGRYRWKFTVDTGTAQVRADTGGTLAHYQSLEDTHAVPTADNGWILGDNEKSPIVVTMDGTRTCGNSNGATPTSASITNGMIIGAGGTLTFDTTASSQLTCTGQFYVDAEGSLNMGTTGTPIPAAYTATLVQSAAANNAPFYAATGALVSLQGAAKSSTTLWKGTYASGAGTAASPLIMNESVDWSVGDEIVISASSGDATNYNQTESRFIITKNSATSYVLSTTSGGAEAALTHTHAAGSLVTNIQRNVVLKGLGPSNGQSFVFNAQPNQTNIDIDWARFEYIDPTLFFGVAPLGFLDVQNNVSIDYTVAYYSPVVLYRINTKTTPQTHTGLVAYSPVASTAGVNAGTAGSFSIVSCQGQTFADCYSLQNGQTGFAVSASFTNTFNNCKAISNNVSDNIATAAGFSSISSGQNSYNDCEAHANRGAGVKLSTALGESFVECLFGTKGANQTTDILPVAGTFNDVLFDSCTFSSTDMISESAVQLQTIGSEIRFNRIDDTDNAHRWYTVYGYGEAEATVIRSPGLAVKLVPFNLTTGFSWQFQVPTNANSLGRFSGYFLKNVALGTGVATISLYLPGNPVSSGVPDATYTLDNTTGASFSDITEQSVDISSQYTGDIPGAIEVVVNVKSNTAGAALYADDFFNAGNRTVTVDEITGLNLWVGGKPLSVISPSVPSAADTAAAVWAYLLANMNTDGSAGELLKKMLTTSKFLGLK